MYIRVIKSSSNIFIIYTYVYTTNGVEYSRIRMSFMLCTKRNLGIREIKVIQSVFNPFGKQETYKNIICFFWDWCYDTCLYSMRFFIVMVEMHHGGYYMKRQKRFSTIWVSSMDFIIFGISCRCKTIVHCCSFQPILIYNLYGPIRCYANIMHSIMYSIVRVISCCLFDFPCNLYCSKILISKELFIFVMIFFSL